MKRFFENTITYIKRHPKVDFAFLGVALVAFAAIALGNITNASVWFDEAFSAYLIQFNYVEIWQFTAADVHPPLYYWLLKTWSLLFGTTELALRSMSLFFAGLSIVGAFLLARKLFGRSVAALSVVFLALSPILIRYSDEMRMYTLAAAIVLFATHVLLKALASKKKGWWVLYGVLVSVGMWTHYFTAVAWIAHWVWRLVTTKKRDTMKLRLQAAYSKQWLWSYVLAVALFLPWIPAFIMQTGQVQAGFWIGPVSINTPLNYLANFFLYLEQWQVKSWWAIIFLVILTVTIIVVPRVYKRLSAGEKKNYLLVVMLAWLSPVILFVLSLPPLRPVFVERYLVPAMVMAIVFFAVTLVVGTRTWRPMWRAVPATLIVVMMVFGITNVYTYGNYNKNSETHILTREVVEMIHEKAPVGTPIVADSPWVFYEAVFYSNDDYPVYFIDEATEYWAGSLVMLRDRDNNKIKDLEAFKAENPIIWFIGSTTNEHVSAYQDSWERLRTVGAFDSLTNKTVYKATEYRVSAE